MKQTLSVGGLISLGCCVAACGGAELEPAPTLRGRLELAALGRGGGEVVAVRDDGSISRAALGSSGEMEIELSREHAYTFAFEDDGVRFARLVFRSGLSSKSVFRVRDPLGVDVGVVGPIADDSEDCRETPDPDPAPDPMLPGDIILFRSVAVAGDTAIEGEDPSADTFGDADDDGIADDVDDDDDDDGICDEDDGEHGDDDGPSDHSGPGDGDGDDQRAKLPYDVKLDVGDTFALIDAFEEGTPAEILDVEMEGSSWRLTELRAGTSFVVTEADCHHQGNRGPGRDRAFISWRNSDRSTEIDHLDLRYCDN